MGYVQVYADVRARLSNHNDERDVRDQATWERLRSEIRKLIDEDPEFVEQIDATLD